MSLLIVQDATKRHGTTKALNGVSLTIPAGSRTAIVGASGSGKTTLLRSVAGFAPLDTGRIVLDGVVLDSGNGSVPPHLREIGYVVQEGALFPHLSVAANVAFGMDRHSPDRQAQVTGLLRQVGLAPDLAGRRPHQLSGGQQQRVALARAMARSPKLMLLDEPFSALDTGLREAMREMVGSVLGDAGITTVLVTHDQAEALSFADHLAVMRDGAIIQFGSPQEVYLRPKDVATARFLGDAIVLNARISGGFADTVLGRVPVDNPAGAGVKSVMIRPEQVLLLPCSSGDRATRAKVVSRRFQGSSWRLVVEHVPDHADDAVLQTSSVFSVDVAGETGFGVGSYVDLRLTGNGHVFD